VGNREKRERWLAEATEITDALIVDAAGRYLCPLCLEWFESAEDLTLEDAPPKSVGGRHVALTCKACNHTAGHTIDAELRKAETLREFGAQKMTAPMDAKFTFVLDGVTIEQRGQALFDTNGLSLAGVPKRNHPDVAPAMIATFDKAAATGSDDWKVTVTIPTPDMRAASVGWLRAGYLATFATLGYLYILRDELEPVRDQIRNPAETIIDRYCVMTRSAPVERQILFATEPSEYASVIAFTNDCAVFLPSDTSKGTYERLAASMWPPGTLMFSGKTVPWPTNPLYAFDRAALAAAARRRSASSC
jgi:hypothetical protein